MRAKKAAEALANAALAQGSSANAKRGLKVCTQYDAISSCCLCCQGSQCTVAFAACFVNLKCFLLSLRLSPCCQAKRKVTPWDTHEGQAMRIRAVMDKFYCAPELASMGVERRAMVLGLAEDIQVGVATLLNGHGKGTQSKQVESVCVACMSSRSYRFRGFWSRKEAQRCCCYDVWT